jgi:hypothetical protein
VDSIESDMTLLMKSRGFEPLSIRDGIYRFQRTRYESVKQEEVSDKKITLDTLNETIYERSDGSHAVILVPDDSSWMEITAPKDFIVAGGKIATTPTYDPVNNVDKVTIRLSPDDKTIDLRLRGRVWALLTSIKHWPIWGALSAMGLTSVWASIKLKLWEKCAILLKNRRSKSNNKPADSPGEQKTPRGTVQPDDTID